MIFEELLSIPFELPGTTKVLTIRTNFRVPIQTPRAERTSITSWLPEYATLLGCYRSDSKPRYLQSSSLLLVVCCEGSPGSERAVRRPGQETDRLKLHAKGNKVLPYRLQFMPDENGPAPNYNLGLYSAR